MVLVVCMQPAEHADLINARGAAADAEKKTRRHRC